MPFTVDSAEADGDPTNDTGPTVAMIGENPQIGLAEALSADPEANGDGTFTLEYTLVATNTTGQTSPSMTILTASFPASATQRHRPLMVAQA